MTTKNPRQLLADLQARHTQMMERGFGAGRIAPMGAGALRRAEKAERTLKRAPIQVEAVTHHTIHGGIYTRTMLLAEGQALAGVLLRVPTTLTISGHVAFNGGEDGEAKELKGFHVLAGSAMRKQVMVALADTWLSMAYATAAKTVEQAEEEFTDTPQMLASRKADAVNAYNITGE